MSFAFLPKPDDLDKPASWVSALAADPRLRPVASQAPRWPTPTELIALVHELFREGSLGHAQMRVLSKLPELTPVSSDVPHTIQPAE